MLAPKEVVQPQSEALALVAGRSGAAQAVGAELVPPERGVEAGRAALRPRASQLPPGLEQERKE